MGAKVCVGRAIGMKIVIAVPLLPSLVLLAMEIRPPRDSTNCFATQSPMPVP
jgi:hypothetical protein